MKFNLLKNNYFIHTCMWSICCILSVILAHLYIIEGVIGQVAYMILSCVVIGLLISILFSRR